MDEWKNLEIDNLPPDMLTGNYEWEVDDEGKWNKSILEQTDILYLAWIRGKEYRYRKPEPEQTHKDILQHIKRELNIQIDTKIADMKKTIIWHMNDLYDCLNSEAE